VPPHSVLAPGTALGLLRSRALPSAQVSGIVGGPKGLSNGTNQRGGRGSTLRPGCSIGVALGQLEIPPVGANSVRSLDAAAWASNGRGQQHVAVYGVARTARNSHQIRPHRPGSVTGRSCSRVSWAVPCEGMSWEQSRQTRTIAASRSDDNRDESRNRDNEQNAGFRATNAAEEFVTSPGAPVTEPPGGEPLPLDKLFQERTETPKHLEGWL
jgi:hypothetical protein